MKLYSRQEVTLLNLCQNRLESEKPKPTFSTIGGWLVFGIGKTDRDRSRFMFPTGLYDWVRILNLIFSSFIKKFLSSSSSCKTFFFSFGSKLFHVSDIGFCSSCKLAESSQVLSPYEMDALSVLTTPPFPISKTKIVFFDEGGGGKNQLNHRLNWGHLRSILRSIHYNCLKRVPPHPFTE
jgi:hypothetical protein